MSLASTRDIAAVHEVVDPWLRVTTYTHARGLGLGADGPYSFEAEVKVDPEVPLGAEFGSAQAAHNVRVHLLSRAGEALAALAAAGWQLTAAPRMELAGRLTRYGFDDDGNPLKAPMQYDISMKLWFEVERSRSKAERAMDPDVVAGEIFATWARGERPRNG